MMEKMIFKVKDSLVEKKIAGMLLRIIVNGFLYDSSFSSFQFFLQGKIVMTPIGKVEN